MRWLFIGLAAVLLSANMARAQVATGRVQVRFYDRLTGKPLAVRAYLQDSRGGFHGPDNTFYYTTADHRFYVDKEFGMTLPVGAYQLTVGRGAQYEMKQAQLMVRANITNRLDIQLERFVDLKEQGWYGGDAQVQCAGHGSGDAYWGHFAYLNKKGISFVDLARVVCKAEGYDWVMTGYEDPPELLPLGGGENWSQFNGHLDLLFDPSNGIRDAMMPVGYYEAYPGPFFFIQRYQIMAAFGGLAYPAHPHMGPWDDPFHDSGWGHSREYPLDIALGRLKVWNTGVVEGGLEVLIKFLNLGFRLACLNETDAYLNWGPGVGPATYLKVPKGQRPTPPCLIQAYQEGRTWVSDGPLLLLQVNGQEVGSNIELDQPAPVAVAVRAYAWPGIEKVEIILNGKPAKTIDGKGKKKMEARFRLPIDRTGYVLAKCYGRENRFLGRLAFTSPIYIRVAGRPLQVDPAAADAYLDYCRRLRKLFAAYAELPNYQRLSAGGYQYATKEHLPKVGLDPEAPLDREVVKFYNKLIDKSEEVFRDIKNGKGPDFRSDWHVYLEELDSWNPKTGEWSRPERGREKVKF